MTAQTRTQLYTFFETGDKPNQAQFKNLIDSSLNIADASGQFIQSDVSCGGTFDVSGAFTVRRNANIAGNLIVSGNSTLASDITITGSANITSNGNLSVGAATFSKNITVNSSGNASLSGNLSVTGPATLTGGIAGVTDGSDAATGRVGQRVISDIGSGSAVALTPGITANVTSISLTAGDWDIFFAAQFTGNTSTIPQNLLASISTTSATLNTTETAFSSVPTYNLATFSFATVNSLLVGPFRQSITGTTTVYAVAQANFGVSTCSVYGAIVARRVR